MLLLCQLGLDRVARLSGQCMAAVWYLLPIECEANRGVWRNNGTKYCCVVNSRYSFAQVVPTQSGTTESDAIQHLNIGGTV